MLVECELWIACPLIHCIRSNCNTLYVLPGTIFGVSTITYGVCYIYGGLLRGTVDSFFCWYIVNVIRCREKPIFHVYECLCIIQRIYTVFCLCFCSTLDHCDEQTKYFLFSSIILPEGTGYVPFLNDIQFVCTYFYLNVIVKNCFDRLLS